MDVYEHLIMIMIIRREVIHFAIKNQLIHLLGAQNDQLAQLKLMMNQNVDDSLSSKHSVDNPLDRYSDDDNSSANKYTILEEIGEQNAEHIETERKMMERRKSVILTR